MLVAELAVEPGQALRELEQAILHQDPALALPLPADASPNAAGRLAHEPPANGEPLSEAESSASVAEVDTGSLSRKLATILVAKLSAERPDADPEVVKHAVASARVDADAIVRRHGGVPVIAMAGELVWVFGMPKTKEDDALRAVRAVDELARVLVPARAVNERGLTVRRRSPAGRSWPRTPRICSGRRSNGPDVGAGRRSGRGAARRDHAAFGPVRRRDRAHGRGRCVAIVGLVNEGVVTRRADPMVDRHRELEAGSRCSARLSARVRRIC